MPLADIITGLGLLLALTALYFLPTMLALDRRVPNKWSVVVINVVLGWTIVGWAVALAMAVRDKPTAAAG